ncbi:MAG: xanthan lyase, partial [Eubacterium sp.]|nr:xanthan lyase [Eubacterium sp.]
MSPRETDLQRNEVVADNDKAFDSPRGQGLRLEGSYRESGVWKTAGVGFADAKEAYTKLDNPFEMGTARMADCVSSRQNWSRAEARWTAEIPERGSYAVYISYKSLPNSSEDAHYTVHHLAGTTEFLVNQKIGGGTWIYLGTFEFSPDCEAYVSLDNILPEGRSLVNDCVVTADAVRFGGGMGKVARGQDDEPIEEWNISGMPAFTEGAVYNM